MDRIKNRTALWVGLIAFLALMNCPLRDAAGQTPAAPPATSYPYPEPQLIGLPPAQIRTQVIQSSPMTLPTLGITPQSAYGPGGPAYRPGTYRPQTVYRWSGQTYNGGLQVELPPADTAPSIVYPQPSVPNAGGLYAAPATLPPIGSGWNHQSQYGLPPLVKFQNLPPGVYPGQGILGQPKAYVDGQPARNLLRYLSPW